MCVSASWGVAYRVCLSSQHTRRLGLRHSSTLSGSGCVVCVLRVSTFVLCGRIRAICGVSGCKMFGLALFL